MSHESLRMDLIARDRYGRALQEGDEILLHLPEPIPFRVVAIRPVLDPKLPNNLVYVDLAATITFTQPNGSGNRQFVRIRTVEEAGPLPFKRLSDDATEGHA